MEPENTPPLHAAATLPTTTVPWGASSTLGVLTAALAALVGAVLAVIHGDHSEGTLTAGLVAAGTIALVLTGRYGQAIAATLKAPPLLEPLDVMAGMVQAEKNAKHLESLEHRLDVMGTTTPAPRGPRSGMVDPRAH